jgi:hypothetical protein
MLVAHWVKEYAPPQIATPTRLFWQDICWLVYLNYTLPVIDSAPVLLNRIATRTAIGNFCWGMGTAAAFAAFGWRAPEIAGRIAVDCWDGYWTVWQSITAIIILGVCGWVGKWDEFYFTV